MRDVARARGAWLRAAAAIVARTVVVAAALYLAFLIVWGLNYRRVPLADKLQFQSGEVSPDAARTLAAAAVERANALYDRAHGGGDTNRAGSARSRARSAISAAPGSRCRAGPSSRCSICISGARRSTG